MRGRQALREGGRRNFLVSSTIARLKNFLKKKRKNAENDIIRILDDIIRIRYVLRPGFFKSLRVSEST